MIYINTDKLKKLNFTIDNFYVVLDFDRTLTTNDSLRFMVSIRKSKIF